MTKSSTIPAGFEDLRGRTFQDRYAIAELVAGSGHRATFVGEREGGGPIVLVLLRPAVLHDAATLARFERRVRACARVRHPAVGGPIDSGETLDGKLWLVFERPEGEPLDRWLAGESAGRMEWAAARPLLLDLVRGLGAGHARGVMHGGVSPACCWVRGVGSDAAGLRLLDWGANTDPASDEAELSYSRTTTLGGDPVFMAPETAGGVFGSERSDAYLVGLVAYVMLVGRPPFQAVNAFQLLSMHLQSPVPVMKDAGAEVPAAVEAWVRGLLAKEPEQRPASMAEVEQGILAIDELGNPRQVGAEELDKPRGRRGRAKAAAREEAVQRLGGSEGAPAQGLGRRLPGQEIVDPRAMGPASPAPRLEPAPAPLEAAPSVDELEQTMMFGGSDVMAAARAAAAVAAASDEPTGTVMLAAPRGAPPAGGLPDATMRLGAELALPSDMPDATLMLSGAELAGGGALQPSTMVLGGEPRRAGPDVGDPTATVALTMSATMFARDPGAGPGHAPTTLLPGGAAPGGGSMRGESAGQGPTPMMGVGSLGFEPRGPAPAPQSMQAPPVARMAPPVSASHPQASGSYVSPAGAPLAGPPMSAPAPAPAGSRVGLWVAILILVAAVAGVAVGLLLAGG